MSLATTIIVPIVGVVLLFVAMSLTRMFQGWLESRRMELAPTEHVVRIRLEDQKERVLTTIRDLDFEYQLGKLSDADYTELRTLSEAEAVEVINALDAIDD